MRANCTVSYRTNERANYHLAVGLVTQYVVPTAGSNRWFRVSTMEPAASLQFTQILQKLLASALAPEKMNKEKLVL